MILLDTNVISEMIRPVPALGVLNWLAAQPFQIVFTTAICKAELLSGLALLPDGGRKAHLSTGYIRMFTDDFAGRVLPFDEGAADVYGEIVAARQRAGRPVATLDAQIAAIARVHGAAVATRNVRDFSGCGIDVVDPWSA